MDIVARLNSFINQLGMPVTQIADSCGIPRPSMTQLLKGRNQKISDDVLRKLHARFPRLNILWLLCGEGDMILNENIETSEPQMTAVKASPFSQPSEQQQSQQTIDFGSAVNQISSSTPDTVGEALQTDTFVSGRTVNDEDPAPYITAGAVKDSASKKTISFAPDNGEKKIVNIIIYYSDNSFEAFVPKEQR